MDDMELGRLLGGAVLAIVTIWWLFKAQKGENSAVGRVRHEGGEVLSVGTIGFLFVDPFKHATSDAAGHRIRVRYGDRTGAWFVRTSSKRPEGEWLWVDDRGDTSLPVPRGDDSRVVPAVRRIPSWVLGVALICLVAGALLARRYLWSR